MPSGNEESRVDSIHRRDYAWVKHAVQRARSAFVLNLDEERFEEQALESVEGPQDELSLALDTYPVDLFGGFNLELMGRIIALYPRR
jgi:hypothetical protein